jgi:hypothetical protein
MLNKITFALVAVFSNVLLYFILVSLERHEDLTLLFKAVRIVFLTSVIMQILIAVGVVKVEQLK